MKLNKYVLLGLASVMSGSIGANERLDNAQGVVDSTQNKSDIQPYVSFIVGIGKVIKISKNEKFYFKSSPYFSGSFGVSYFDIDSEIALNCINNFAATHINYEKNDSKDLIRISERNTLNSYSLLGNIIYNYELNKNITPYVGIGVGVSKPRIEREISYVYVDNSKNKVDEIFYKNKYISSYQLIIGNTFKFEKNFKILLDYRFNSTFKNLKIKTSKYNDEFKDFSKMKVHSINMGIKYNF